MASWDIKKIVALGICFLFLSLNYNYSCGNKLNYLFPYSSDRSDILCVGGTGPGNYSKIQEAIDEANDGDIIFVFRGVYYENLFINKKIYLFGEDKDSTIIDGGKTVKDRFLLNQDAGDYVLLLLSTDSVQISDFSIRYGEIGLIFDNSSNNKISYCNIYSNNIGLKFNNSNYNICNQCSIFKNTIDGVQLSSASNNFLNKINIFLNDRGAFFENSNYNTVECCNISNNNLINIWFSSYSNNNTIFRCNINKGSSGLGFELFSNNNIIYHNNFVSNNDQDIDNAYDECENVWDKGNTSGGNYWDDYQGIDENGDGFGDTPYLIDGGESKDNFPLINPEVFYDIMAPSVEISKPVRGLYILGLLVRRFLFRRPLVIGRIAISATVIDNSLENSSIVEFYINGKLRKTDSTPPFDFTLIRDRFKIFGHRYTLKVVGIDQSGNSGETYIKIWKFL